MAHAEPWQVFHPNGREQKGLGKTRQEFTDDLIMAASHVWVWRRTKSNETEVLLQRRAQDKSTWPGYLDISAAGHIDLSEDGVESAVREAQEEINLTIDAERLLYIFSLRTHVVSNEIDHVYLYEVDESTVFRFDDGEVDSVQWAKAEEFYKFTRDPAAYNMVNLGEGYFLLLRECLERL